MKTHWIAVGLLACIFGFGTTTLDASEFVFENGFESGELCAWSASDCSVDELLARLDDASTIDENETALLATFEKSVGSIPPEVEEAIGVIAEFNVAFPSTKGGFLDIAQAHRLAVLSVDDPPTLGQALAALEADVERAFASPQAPDSALIVLMFSASSEMISPLPLTADTELTVTGSMTYAAWLARTFPAAFDPVTRISQTECVLKVRANQVAAASQIVLRNMAVIVFNVAKAILNSAEAVVNCSSGGVTEVAGIVLDAVEGCAVSQLVSWVEVDADADCVGDVTGPPSIVGCVAGLVPCLGDIESVIGNAVGVVQATENTINGVCTAFNLREGLIAACEAGCPTCSELEYESGCGLSNFSACFDPLNAVPTVACIDLDTPSCADFGAPEITAVHGATVVPGGGEVANRVYFEDADAGINWFTAVRVADSCGGCWSSNGWDPDVAHQTTGSFDFYWFCTCGSSVDFHATYHLQLYDEDGNVSPPFTKQVSCACSSRSESSDAAGPSGGGLMRIVD